MILHVTIENKVAVYQKRDGDIVCANSGYQIQFTFDSEWDAYPEKTARFKWNGSFIDVPFTGDTCDVPEINNALECEVGVYAGDLCTTTPAVIGCKKSILCGAATPSTENDRRYANEAKEAAERAEAVADRIPYIKNGTWWIGDVDTGASAQGGAAGKSVHVFTTDYEDTTEALRAMSESSETHFFVVNESTLEVNDGDVCLVRCKDTTKNSYAYIVGQISFVVDESIEIYPKGIIESGADGKSAYDYAVEGGYTGTETEFAAKLAEDIPAVDTTLTQSGQAADAATVGERLSALSEEIGNAGNPTDGQVSAAVSDWLEANPDATATVQDETITEAKLTQAVRDRLNPPTSTVTAYGAGDVKAIKRNDIIHDNIIPMMNTKYFNTRRTLSIQPETTDKGNNVIHESTIVAAAHDIAMVIYLENMTGSTTDTAIRGGDTRIRARYLFDRYGVVGCIAPAVGAAFDIMYPGVELSDGTIAVGGFGTCTAFSLNQRVYVLAEGYDAESKNRLFVSYADIVTGNYWNIGNIPEATWSAPQPMMLTANGETVEYTASALATACGLSGAIIQNNNQVWVQGTTFYMAVNIRSQGVAVLTSTDGITWTYKGFFTTKYKCGFIHESACAFRENRLWIASRNSYASSTTSDDKNNGNFLTLIKVNTQTWTKIDEWNIPDCGCKPFFIPTSTCLVNGVKALLLMHNPYTRNSAEILAIGEYPMYSLGEIQTGANYITACSQITVGQILNVMTCGTNGLVTARKGALVHCAINIRDRTGDITVPINEYLNGCGTSWYSVTNTLTNVSTNNQINKVKAGMQYVAVLTPDDGYTLDTVTVKINGANVTSACYSSGVVAIGNVTGNITITATASVRA